MTEPPRPLERFRGWLFALGAIAAWVLLATNSAEAQSGRVPDIVLAQVLGRVPTAAPSAPEAQVESRRAEDFNRVAQAMRKDFQAQIVAGVARPSVELEVHFDWDSDQVHRESGPAIEAAAEVLNQHFPTTRFRVAGYADPSGEPDYNQRLSERRATVVWRMLVEQFGVDAERLEREGFGVDDSEGIQSDRQRRRVELQILRPASETGRSL